MTFSERLVESLVRQRLRWAVLSLLLALLLGAGISQLIFVNDYKIFFDPDDPQLIAHLALQDEFTKSDNVAFILGVDDGTLFRPDRLQAIESLTEELWHIPHAVRVDSLTNYQFSEARDDDLHVFPLFEGAAELGQAEIDRRAALALADRVLQSNVISRDGRTSYINVRLEMPVESVVEAGAATAEIVRFARQRAMGFAADNPDFTIFPMGVTVIDQAFHEETLEDLVTLVPQMFLVIVLLTAALLRSLMATAAIVAVIALTLPATMGLAGWLGFDINQINAAAPTIILTLCVCDGVHVLVSHVHEMRGGRTGAQALGSALRINLQPIFLTSATTAIGFVCLNFSDSPPFRDLGNITAIGVLLAFVFTLGVIPLFAGSMKPGRGRSGDAGPGMMEKLAGPVLEQRGAALVLGLLIAGTLIAAAPRNELTDSTIDYFHPDTQVRRAATYLEERLTGMDALSYSLPAGNAGGIADPRYLAQLDAFTRWYRAQPEVAHVASFSDVMRRLNRNMHGDDPAYDQLPESRELAAQYLLLYEMSLPFGLDLSDQINFDKSATRFVARLREVKAKHIVDVDERAQAWLAANAPELQSPGVGVSLMFAHIGQNNIRSMLVGSVVALLGVSFTLMLALRSIRLGLLSLIPNAFPALMAFGIWGLSVGEVNLAVAAIFSITLGIVVDDTVHYLSKYLRARRDGKSPLEANRYAFTTVGFALVATTVVLALGFLTLAQSDFAVNALTGRLVAMTIAIALVYDLIFLPALLMYSDRWLRVEST